MVLTFGMTASPTSQVTPQTRTPPTVPALVVMVKAPRPGTVKTRLAPVLSAGDAAALAACFVRDVGSLARRLVATHRTFIAYAPADERTMLETLLRVDEDGDTEATGLTWIEQQGVDLGARLRNATNRVAESGCCPVIVIGTDSPSLPVAYLEEATSALANDEADIVLGATDDGGYYLIGVRRKVEPEMFDGVEWSTERVYQQTARQAENIGLRLHALPTWYDVDTAEDLWRLNEELHTDARARQRAAATYGWLKAHAPILHSL